MSRALEALQERTSYADTEVEAVVASAPKLSAAQQGQLAALLRVTS